MHYPHLLALGQHTPQRFPELAPTLRRCRHKTPRRRITTTLYTLMAALQEQVGPDNDAVVVTIVWALIRSRRLTFGRTSDTPESTG
jgi:hypothetical protein